MAGAAGALMGALVELRHVHPVRVAGAVISVRNAGRTGIGLIAVLILLRAVMAAWLPLSADEAYYWLWSRHLAAGYYDHPPAIAFLIRLGTLLFGDTRIRRARSAASILSPLASWFVWQAGAGRSCGMKGAPRWRRCCSI